MKKLLYHSMVVALLCTFALIAACSGNGGDDDDDDAAPDPVDESWGPGPDRDTRVEIFEDIWEALAGGYAAFAVKDIDWDEMYDEYLPRIESAESHGRFFQVLADLLGNRLQDGHTWIFSQKVCFETDLAERPPVFRLSMHTSTLGACVSPGDAGELIVYRVARDNPAGLEPGDVIVGYDGAAWSDLLLQIDAWEYPVCGIHAPAPSAEEYNRLVSVTSNAHLFGTLDVVRYGSSDVESIPTEDLIQYRNDPAGDFWSPAEGLVCPDQMALEGLDFPWTDYADSGDPSGGEGQMSWGTLDGTNVGYVYIYSWGMDVFEDFRDAVTDLWETDGLIIDQRYNVGGYAAWENGMEMLFDTDHDKVIFQAFRDPDGDDYNDLDLAHPRPGYGWMGIDADEETCYDHPIAVLQGPHAASAGDIFPYLMTRHPRARRFGSATHGSFGGLSPRWFSEPDPYISDLYLAYTNHTDLDADFDYLQGTDQTPEAQVRFNRDDAASGVDTVVEAALSWISEENSK